jgi:UDP-GlcNAc:undecaprenyl-phosphate/decaprenyl-phosphate GlcNAc-1-phosphate transferase
LFATFFHFDSFDTAAMLLRPMIRGESQEPIATMILSLSLFAVMGMAVTYLLIPSIQRYFTFLERERAETPQFHQGPNTRISRLGGLGVVGAFCALSLSAKVFYPFDAGQSETARVIFCSSLSMFLLGFWDDIKALGAKRKLFAQIVIAAFTWCGGIQIETWRNPLTGHIYPLGGFGACLTVFWLVAFPNLVNIIDGIDGLAAGISLMLMGVLALSGFFSASLFPQLCAAGMVGAILGFLRYNFPPAKIYMGDGGAYFLGFLVAELSIVNSHKGTIVASLLVPLFVLALPILDVSLAIARRGLAGLPIFRPDRRHIHHHLLGLGYSPRKAVLALYFVTLVFLSFGVVVFWAKGRWTPILFGLVTLAGIVSARSFSLRREWFAVGRVLGNSLEMRESIHYALASTRWFEMDAKDCDSVENLWVDFQLILLKLNFVRANLTLPDGKREWKRGDMTNPLASLAWSRYQIVIGESATLDLAIEDYSLNPVLFRHIAEIAAESWQRSAAAWCRRRHLPLRFESRAYQAVPRRGNQGGRAYVPVALGQFQALKMATLHDDSACQLKLF